MRLRGHDPIGSRNKTVSMMGQNDVYVQKGYPIKKYNNNKKTKMNIFVI